MLRVCEWKSRVLVPEENALSDGAHTAPQSAVIVFSSCD